MKTPDQLLKAGLTGQGSRPAPYSPQPRQVKLVAAMWERMTQLFGHKWISTEGEPLNENGDLSENFVFWCKKTEDLSNEAWRRGFDRLEFQVRDSARQGDEAWPPSYAAFLGMCDEPEVKALHKPFARRALPDKGAEERARKAGETELSRMLNLFDD